jgi:hypothetical protein
MEQEKFQVAVIAELAALKYVIEQLGKITLLAAAMRPEDAAAMRQVARDKLPNEAYVGLEEIWSDELGRAIADGAASILTNIETSLADAYQQARRPSFM